MKLQLGTPNGPVQQVSTTLELKDQRRLKRLANHAQQAPIAKELIHRANCVCQATTARSIPTDQMNILVQQELINLRQAK